MNKTLAPVASLFLGMSFLLCGNGLLTTLLPLRGHHEGFSAIALGLVGSSYYAGFVLGCLFTPFIISRVGHIRSFSALVALGSAAALGYVLFIDEIPWVIIRAVTGFAMAGLYLIVESWLNDRATNETRGFIMSAYIIVNFATVTAGQMMVTVASISTFTLFAISSILVSLAAVPVALSRSDQPAPITLVRFRPLKLYRTAPVGIFGTFMVGVANSAFWALGTLYATERGLTTDGAAIFMSVAVIAGALAQWPAGKLSDIFDRRLVLAGMMIVAASISLLLVVLPLNSITIFVMAAAFGATTLTTYSIAAAHAYDRTDKADVVEMATGVLLSNGLGAIIGPLSASFLMEAMGPSWLFIFIAMMQLLLTLFIGVRLSLRSGAAQKTNFEVYSTSPVGGVLSPDPIDEAHGSYVMPRGLAGKSGGE